MGLQMIAALLALTLGQATYYTPAEAQTLFAAICEIRSAATAANAIADAQGLSGRSLDAANNLFDGY